MPDARPPTHPTTVLQNLLRHVQTGLMHVGAYMWLVAGVSPDQIAAGFADPASASDRPDLRPAPQPETGPGRPRPL
ncbi:hypothetical protein [Thermomonospora cellulosilytica]|uniref:Uncharacterized protein n=1 Tax=Thermomonospora cellulosilytica TaxID=1411118 RepID=A0A7W3N0Y6_9ACTN|nr:hypothetical protein [Thermomonospora cellulosilytica]MBA9005529.1 hypothetical protein [Thermomonospora cellulosilytica]